ncbi:MULTISPECIES: CinA family protein [unclassified Rhodococcus (in: high G+C Gram-positive bacteria)]|uniref:CinA family protein n=1 Tax=unclassified Rhodococcus (in: high G+C Gram-positive bacteria) TaxID=192944 RepID=UPI00278B2AC7|nr:MULTISPECIES: CinA family protein [unclassified Rhodococcus (in: high G+C Gram-positive bacteria)]MDQ1181105.1 nicotinamide-nucleotide amidase [Rhodococcus sp. SORGH_AS_0301]
MSQHAGHEELIEGEAAEPEQRVDTDEDLAELCSEIAELALERDLRIATAESLTAGNIAANLGRASSSGTWFRGSIVAYASEVKYSLLQVPRGPVVSEEAATAMASGAASALGADLAVAVTGEAGPETNEDVEPGTVWFGIADHGTTSAERVVFEGDPKDVLAATIERALRLLRDHARSGAQRE